MRGSGNKRLPRNQLIKELYAQHLGGTLPATAPAACGQSYTRKATASAAGAFGERWPRRACVPSNPARLYCAPPTPTRTCTPPLIACWTNLRLPRQIKFGWVISPTCPNRAAAGFTWLPDSTATRAKSSAGTYANPCPRTWSARPYVGQSMRLRTASAACRSERFSANCSSVTKCQLPGSVAACPRYGNRSAKRASSYKGAEGIAQLDIAIAARESRLRYLARLGRNRRAGSGA